MLALDNMRKRLSFVGGDPQQSRMIRDKLRSLKKALLYSYQAGTMVLEVENYEQPLEFRCLMNPDKITFDIDRKMLSVPFKDVCLNLPRAGTTTEGEIDIPIDCGDTFIWKETNTRWLVTLKYLEELAYFRADVRKCFPFPLNIDGKEYWFASIGENEQTIEWLKKGYEEWNKMNYTRTIYIKRNPATLEYFKRFKVIKLPNILGELESWEVQAVNPNSTEDVLILHIKEYFENPYEEISKEEQAKKQEEHELNEDLIVYAYDNFACFAQYEAGAAWEIKNETEGLKFKLDAMYENGNSVATVQLMTGKTGSFDVYYADKLIKHVVVKSIT